MNLGFIYQNENFYGSIDWWRYDFKDPLQTESAGQIVAAYAAQQCFNGGSGETTSSCQALRSHIFPLGTSIAGLQRTVVNIINGSDIETSGIDATASYDFTEVFGGTLTVGFEGTYTLEYKSDDFLDINGALLAPGGDFAGLLNDGTNPFQSLPELKGNIFVRYAIGEHRFNFVTRYVDSYKDADPAYSVPTNPLALFAPQLANIDDQVTFDLHYNTTSAEEFFVSFSVVNLTDEDPPQTATDLNYDPYTHNPFGRMFKLGVRYSLGGN